MTQPNEEKKADAPQANPADSLGFWLAIGVATGAGIGAAIQNIAIGVGVGVALGAGIGALRQKKASRTPPD